MSSDRPAESPDPDFIEEPFGSKVLFESGVVQIGATRCPASHPDFESPGPIQRHAFYLGGTPVHIVRSGQATTLADATTVSFHHRGEEPERRAFEEEGDCSNWFAVTPDCLLATLESLDATVNERIERPFLRSQGPCSPRAFLMQRLLIDELTSAALPDRLRVEESALELLSEVTRGAGAVLVGKAPSRNHRGPRSMALASETQELISASYRSGLSLAQIAEQVGSSPFHLSRVFRTQTGWSLHGFRNQLRLRAAAAAVLQGESDLTQLALDLGFSSHSHLTTAFKKAFGLAPSALREAPGRVLDQLRQMG